MRILFVALLFTIFTAHAQVDSFSRGGIMYYTYDAINKPVRNFYPKAIAPVVAKKDAIPVVKKLARAQPEKVPKLYSVSSDDMHIEIDKPGFTKVYHKNTVLIRARLKKGTNIIDVSGLAIGTYAIYIEKYTGWNIEYTFNRVFVSLN